MGPPVVFSDIDGTIVHYPEVIFASGHIVDEDRDTETGLETYVGTGANVDAQGQPRKAKLLRLPPSSSGLQGFISAGTLDRMARIRRKAAGLVIISGARTATILQRLPYLPAADAFATENGGRLFWSDATAKSALQTALPLREDSHWRLRHRATAGPPDQLTQQPQERQGLLWDWYRRLLEAGWKLDTNGYSTSFRVVMKPPHTPAELAEATKQLPKELKCSYNLGSADIYPATSGKEEVAAYTAEKLMGEPEAVHKCLFLCDDDNDLQLAARVKKAFLPSISTATVQRAVDAEPERFVVCTAKGAFASEEVLDQLLNELQADATPPAQ